MQFALDVLHVEVVYIVLNKSATIFGKSFNLSEFLQIRNSASETNRNSSLLKIRLLKSTTK